jgi:DNA-binding transcriptional regulator YhcF (GntR family)
MKKEPKSIFLTVFGETPQLKLLDFLVVSEDFDYSMTDIARLSGVHYITLRKLWPELERTGMVIMTRKIGKAKMYRYNSKNPLAKKFKEFFWAITKAEVRKYLQQVTVTH